VTRRLLDILAPVRPADGDRGYRRVLRWAALPVTNRRWAAPLCALALGFGLFAGVAIGPGASGTLATGTPPVIEIPSLLSDGNGEAEAESEGEEEAGGLVESEGGDGGESSFLTESSSGSIAGFPEVETPESSESTESVPAAKGPPATDEEKPVEEEEEAQVLAGVVVHANPAAGSYTVAEAGGLLSAVHAAELPAPGARVSVPVRTLANGTFAEAGPRKQKGKATRVGFAGIVTFVEADPVAPAYTVSKRGVSVLVRIHPNPAGAPALLPPLGAYATVEVTIEKAVPASAATPPPVAEVPAPATPPTTCLPDPALPPPPAPLAILWQSRLDADGAPFASSDFEGVVTAVCAAEGTLLLSADDLRASGKDLLFTVPKSIDTGKLKTGDSVAATAAIEAGGALRLTGLAGDERVKGADDAAAAQGDLASQKPG